MKLQGEGIYPLYRFTSVENIRAVVSQGVSEAGVTGGRELFTHCIDPHLVSRFFWQEDGLWLFLHSLLVATITENPPTTMNNKRNISDPTLDIIFISYVRITKT